VPDDLSTRGPLSTGSESGDPTGLTHLDEAGAARMVDVSAKAETDRLAEASAILRMEPSTLEAIYGGHVPKGDVLAVARVAGIQAAKSTPSLIPLCHPIPLSSAEVRFRTTGEGELEVRALVRTVGRTGAEMEALCAVTVAALTVYDMCKALDRGMSITGVRLERKSGGRSGSWTRR
jgi:cyclic pyranopterin monophosphate synthase